MLPTRRHRQNELGEVCRLLEARRNTLLIHYTDGRTSEHVSREATPASGFRHIAKLEWPSSKVGNADGQNSPCNWRIRTES